MSLTKRHHQLPGWRDEEDDNDFGAPWINFPFNKQMRVYDSPTHARLVIAVDEEEAIRVSGEPAANFRKIFKDVGSVMANGNLAAGVYRLHHDVSAPARPPEKASGTKRARQNGRAAKRRPK